MLRVLFFDDDQNRWETIKKKSSGVTLEWVQTVEEAKAALRDNFPYDIICLDHDIGGQMLACTQNCGCNVAEAIVLMDPLKVPMIVLVHSWNPDGSTRMMGMLDGVGVWDTLRAPFGSFHFKDKEIIVR